MAAVAMSDSSSYEEDQQDVNQSICPAGWTLPKSGSQTSSGSFAYLMQQYSNNDVWAWMEPLSFSLSGFWGGYFDSVGGGGYYWASTVSSSYAAYFFDLGRRGKINVAASNGRSLGLSLRCVAR